MAVEANGRILKGDPKVVRLTPEGSLDPDFLVRLGGASIANALWVEADGGIVVGGNFNSVNGLPARGLARLRPDAAPPQPFVERRMGAFLQVTLAARPPAGASRYVVEDQPSWGPVRVLSPDGRYDAASGKVVFGPFADAQPRTLAYMVLIPPGAAGMIQFQGAGTVDGFTTPILGDASLRIWPFPPPPLWVEMRWRPLSQALILQVWGEPNTTHVVEASRDLLHWEEAGRVSSPTGVGEFDASAALGEYRFYRAKRAE
jgi:hypothetical protein